MVICGLISLMTGLILGSILYIIGYFQHRKWKIMRDTPTRMIVDIEPGRVEVNGRIQPVSGGLLYSPLTGIPCVQFEVKVQEYRSNGKSRYWATIHTNKRGSLFLVADESGNVLVDPAKVKMESIRTLHSQQGMFNEMNAKAQNYIQQMGINDKGFFGVFKRTLRVLESVIPLNKHLYVLGDAVDDPKYRDLQRDPLTSPFTIKKKGTMILSFKSEKELASSRKTAWMLLYIFAGVSAFFGLAGMLFFL